MAEITIGKCSCTTSALPQKDGRFSGRVRFEAKEADGGTAFDALTTGTTFATAEEAEAAALADFRRGMTLGQLKF